MKNLNTLFLALTLISTPAFAKSTGSSRTIDTATYTRSAPQSGGHSFALGLTTFSSFGGSGGLSALIPVGQNSIQTTLVLGTSGGFSIIGSGLYKATVVGNSDTGFHLGGGLGFGVASSAATTIGGFTVAAGGTSFTLLLSGVLGIHHELVANKIQVSFDAGPVITVLPAFAFSIAPFSTLAGFSVHYFI
ncbi:MAG: hypothetical protein KA715_02760 [Xanthomonadaceae bacterium]|nr:hypothetical protein [Xanthomonadaceae bacterium]